MTKSVGVAGHSLHGGFGFSSHTHGLAVDWIQSATVVLANATVVEASETVNPDLFWAIRGSGSNFGIVSTFKFRTFAAPSQVTVFSVNLPWNSGSAIATGWAAMQDWIVAGNMPKEMNFRVFGSPSQTQLQGMYHGDSNSLRTAIQPLLSKLGASLSQAQQQDWMGAFTYYTYGSANAVDVSYPYNMVGLHSPFIPQHRLTPRSQVETFYSKSLVTSALPTAALQAVGNYWQNTARKNNRDWFIIIDAYGGKNSAITSRPANSSGSYAFRDQVFLYELYDRVRSGSYPSDGFSLLNGWVKSFTDNLKPEQWGMYVNYADPQLNRTEATSLYYKQNLPRLQQIKRDLDPKEVFYYPQAVAPAK